MENLNRTVDVIIWDRTSFLGYFFSPLPDKVLAIKYDDELYFTISNLKGEFVSAKKVKKINHVEPIEVPLLEYSLGQKFLKTVAENRYLIHNQKEFLKAYVAIVKGLDDIQDKTNAFEQGLYFKGWQ